MAKKKKKKEVIKSTDLDGKKIELAILRPTSYHYRKAQMTYNSVFREAVESGAFLRQNLEAYMRKQGLWNDQKQEEYEKITTKINENEKKLASGGIKLSVAKDIAIQMRRDRLAFRELIGERTSLDGNTAEGQADNARFNHLVTLCVLNPDTGDVTFESIEDYEFRSDEPYAVQAASTLAELLYDLDPDYEKSLAENEFLHKYKFVDDDMRLVNKEGELVDVEGRLIDEDGRYIDADGEYVDIDGNPLDEEGNFKIETQPFLDDDGNPILESEPEEDAVEEEVENVEEEEVVAETPKKKTRKTAKTTKTTE